MCLDACSPSLSTPLSQPRVLSTTTTLAHIPFVCHCPCLRSHPASQREHSGACCTLAVEAHSPSTEQFSPRWSLRSTRSRVSSHPGSRLHL
eukprot:1155628-Pelagomonas_calceolata.AAC.1